ncbi:MAG: type VI secretion system baseplate subunit TssE [Acidobacteriota bacterium]|nr:type VI secretion system baseplate subunit TssE [Acidobacteriota bacterium]
MRDSEIRITPSVVDRLLDFEPKVSSEAPKSRSQGLRELKQSVRRDLEWLLNTRHSAEKVPDGLEEVNKSIAVYGLPDFTGLSSKNIDDRKSLIRNIETALKNFEPRFMNLKVAIVESDEQERGVKFQIQAILRIEPTPEPVVFDTVLQVGSGEFKVEEK